jgi:hypothetical protein
MPDLSEEIQVTKSGVRFVDPSYYLDDPEVREEMRSMKTLFEDYKNKQNIERRYSAHRKSRRRKVN